ncbi:MAG: hypothetical protein K6G18_05325 [Treponema sp.]|nr:hypothetical protein [Treponema sp.]
MNTLSFVTERVDLEQGDGLGKYLAFFFLVDGRKIDSGEYNPADSHDILDDEARQQKLTILAHCDCGCWECNSLVAEERPVSEKVISWTVYDFRSPQNPQSYYFDRKEYEKTIAAIRRMASEEIERTKQHLKTTITMRPEDSFSLFWWEDGTCCGGAENISLSEDGPTIDLNIPGLQDWLNEYMWNCLAPCESGELTPEELLHVFDWKRFHQRGLSFATEVKKLLPATVELIYSVPYEDISGTLENGEVFI